VTLPSAQESEAFEQQVLACRTLLERMEGGLAIAARWTPRDYSCAPHLSAMLSRALWLYGEGRTERAQRYVGFVQGTMVHKYGLSQSELAELGVAAPWGILGIFDARGDVDESKL
jgi:hypothetical protein